jgi:hypothetical protein
MTQRIPVIVGMGVRLRKPHACGGDTWTVTRTGADVGLLCASCGRRIMLEREEFERRVKQILEPSTDTQRPQDGADPGKATS